MNLQEVQALPVVHYDWMFNESEKWYSYKYISVYEAVRHISFIGDIAEFGVAKGETARFILSLVRNFHECRLFDSFEGLPEAWEGTNYKKGAFAVSPHSIPVFKDARVHVVKGWFSNTVKSAYAERTVPLSFIHMDADLYSSTMDAFHAINHLIVPGTVLLFDEYLLKTRGKIADDEHRALNDWCSIYGREVEYLFRTKWAQVACRVKK